MKPHLLDRRISIQTATTATNAFGEKVQSWATTASTWAQVNWKVGNEDFNDGVEVQTQGVRFIIRYRPNLSTKNRIIFDGVTYDIEGINEPKRREMLEVDCRSRE